jgi:copper chaperone CopZ
VKTATLRIDGMHCDGCARTIEALLSTEPGVKAASASFHDRRARVLFDPAATTEARLATAIEKAGFAVEADAS